MPNEAIPEAMLAQMREMTQLMISVTLAKRAGNFPAYANCTGTSIAIARNIMCLSERCCARLRIGAAATAA